MNPSPTVVVTALLWLLSFHGYCTKWPNLCEALTLLAKTKETFKLAELQLLEAQLQAQYPPCLCPLSEECPPFNLTRVLIDRLTGSSLLRLETHRSGERSHEMLSSFSSISSLKRCDWIGEVIALAHNPDDFLTEIHCLPSASMDRVGQWTLDYVRMDGTGVAVTRNPSCTQTRYTMKSLLCAVANALPSPPALDPNLADHHLILVDTIQSFYLIRTISPKPSSSSTFGSSERRRTTTLEKLWARRPFQYSSAINTGVAESVIEILNTLCRRRDADIANNSNGDGKLLASRLRLLDPTCGSGTFLAIAIARGFQVVGYDINPACVTGSLRNLEFIFSKDVVDDFASVQLCDSSRIRDVDQLCPPGKIDCVVANLPWGRNSVEYADENRRILCSVRARIESGTPCAFVTRVPSSADLSESGALQDLPTSLFTTTGFAVLGQAYVPQRGFALPSGLKNKKKEKRKNGTNGKAFVGEEEWSATALSGETRINECVITIAMSTK
jgi:hypothetical protein